MGERIGILGGSFDPVHLGHLNIAEMAAQHFSLDSVLFFPAGSPPHKLNTVVASAARRCEMLRLALQDNPRFHVRDDEIHRSGPSYTIDTIRQVRREFPSAELYYCIGSDNLSEIPAWKDYASLAPLITLCVCHRPGYSFRIPPALKDFSCVRCPSPEWALSSHRVREYLEKGISCRYLLPEAVWKYIQDTSLYIR